MFHLAWPWLLLALPLPWLLARLWPAAKTQQSALFLPFAAALGSSAAAAKPPIGSFWQRWLRRLIWLLLVLAAVRPQWLGEPQPVATEARQLLLAVDVSGSMAAEDMAGGASRLQVVQQVAGEFITRREGDQVGLILFGSQPYLQAPLTQDLATVKEFLQQSMVGIAGRETAVGDAIGLALKRLRDAKDGTSAASQTVLILLTDGRSNAGVLPPAQAAQLAAQAGLRIYTIGVGASQRAGFFGLVSGNSDLDEDALKDIARTTGGAYFRAEDARDLQAVYQRIEQLEPSAGRDQWLRPRHDWFHWPLALALWLSLPLLLWGPGRAEAVSP